ncbi:hypothetical protein HQ633_11410, partial [Enterococcus faecium]|nr:hypothetical protein [Enterococcus faecium]
IYRIAYAHRLNIVISFCSGVPDHFLMTMLACCEKMVRNFFANLLGKKAEESLILKDLSGGQERKRMKNPLLINVKVVSEECSTKEFVLYLLNELQVSTTK